jgi:hypothetical protein
MTSIISVNEVLLKPSIIQHYLEKKSRQCGVKICQGFHGSRLKFPELNLS